MKDIPNAIVCEKRNGEKWGQWEEREVGVGEMEEGRAWEGGGERGRSESIINWMMNVCKSSQLTGFNATNTNLHQLFSYQQIPMVRAQFCHHNRWIVDKFSCQIEMQNNDFLLTKFIYERKKIFFCFSINFRYLINIDNEVQQQLEEISRKL